MRPVEFWKMSGSGNDFILIDNRDGQVKNEEMGFFVERVCRRRESVGADGVIFIADSNEYDFVWRFFNLDGGEVEMCGNGSRCVARFAYMTGIAGSRMTFGTLAGPVSAEVRGRVVKVLIPPPKDITMDLDIEHKKGWRDVNFINTSVPHVVIRVEDISNHPVKEQGRAIRYHPCFRPEGTNVNFMMKSGHNLIDIRTYERGVEDETLACGTGAVACAMTAALKGEVTSPVKTRTLGGDTLTIYFKKRDDASGFDEVWLEGNTTVVYKARLSDEALA